MHTHTLPIATVETVEAQPLEVPTVPAEQLERIATVAPLLPSREVPRIKESHSAPRAWKASGTVD